MYNVLKEITKKTSIYRCLCIFTHIFRTRNKYTYSTEYETAMNNIEKSDNMVDLGCGNTPHPKAKVAVDKYIEPIHRKFGSNKKIEVSSIEKRGISFVEADFENLPFADNEFDFAYSHHVVEHLDNPIKGMQEMMRIARGG